MSLLCIKLRSFLGVILHSDCLSPPSPPPPPPPSSPHPPLLPPQPDVASGRQLQEQEEEHPIATVSGSKPPQSEAGQFPVHPSRMAGETPHQHGPAVHPQQQQMQRPTRSRSSADGASAILVPSSVAAPPKPVQNIYRKPISRINSNPSLRRSRDHHIRCNQRLSRHVQLWESDPGDVFYYYSPSGSTQLPGVGPTQGGQVEENLQGVQDYRRRVYTMPSAVSPSGPDAPSGSCRRKVPRSLEIRRETALGRGTSTPKDKQQLLPCKDEF